MINYKELIKNSRMAAQQNKKDKWLTARSKCLEFFKGRTEFYTKKMYKPTMVKKIPIDNNNITKRIIERISLVYSVPIIRSFTDLKDDDTKVVKYAAITKKKDVRLHKAEKYTNLLNIIVLHPMIRNGVFEYDIITDFEPHFDEDPMEPVGISYPLKTKSEVTNTDPEWWAYWDKKRYVVYDANDTMEKAYKTDIEHGYGLFPFVFILTEEPETELLDIDPANDIISMNHTINVLGTDQNANVRFQSFGMPYATGFAKKTTMKLEVGPDKWTQLPPGATVGMLNPPNTLLSLNDTIKTKYAYIANNYHLPQGFMSEEGQPESGRAKKIRNQELTSERAGDIKRYRVVEDEIYEIEVAEAKKDLKFTLPKPELFSVDYQEEVIDLSVDEQRDEDEWKLKHNMTSEAEILYRDNPDKYKDIKEAQKAVDEYKNAKGVKSLLESQIKEGEEEPTEEELTEE